MAYLDRSIWFTALRTAVLREEPFDEKPGEGELIGRTLVSVVSSGSETGGYTAGVGYPMQTGYAGILEVLEVGTGVVNIQPGDKVFAKTPHKLYNRIPANDSVLVPKGLDPECAVMCRFPAVSMTTMIRTHIRPTEPILVAGLGIIGLSCALMMQHCGYEVHAVDPIAERRKSAAKCGLSHVYATVDSCMPHYGSFGLSIDCAGTDSSVDALADATRLGGELSLLGVPWTRHTEITMHSFMRKIFYRYLAVYSGFEWSLPLHESEFNPNSNYHSFAKAMQWIAEGSMKLGDISTLYHPSECGAVYDIIADRRLPSTCAMFDWREYHDKPKEKR